MTRSVPYDGLTDPADVPISRYSAFIRRHLILLICATLVGGAIGATGPAATSQETFWAVRRAFEAVARRRPLLVCFEDIHWAEPTFLDLIDYLVGWSRGAPLHGRKPTHSLPARSGGCWKAG